MAYLKINQYKINEENIQELLEICPFQALERTNAGLEITAACKMCMLCVKRGSHGIIELVNDDVKIDKAEWRGIVVYVDHLEGRIHPVTYELLGKAKELASVIDHPVYALFIGDQITSQAEELLYYGIERVFVYEHATLEHFVIEPYANVFADFINKVKPTAILVGATNVGRSLAPRVAARFRTGLTADCTMLEMRKNTDLVQIRPAYGGNIMAQIVTENNRPQFCTVRYKIFDAPERDAIRSGAIEHMEIAEEMLNSNIEVIEIKKKEKSVDISEAEVIVAVGRGVKAQKDLVMVEELAQLLGARIACTRPLIENGWFDSRLQIGLSGRTVKPKLIITLGISGSVQFAAGMQNAETIIAVNQDKNAAIFNIANYGIIGDLYDIIPQLIAQIKAES